MSTAPPDGLTYRRAGVDIAAQDALVARIAKRVRTTYGPGVMEGIGGFAALFSLRDRLPDLTDPVLVSGTDGVGTKLDIAFATGRHDTVGIDLVAMCVNDVVTTGAEPLFFLDYFATGRLDPAVGEAVVAGIAKGCERAGCALIGGETAEMPGMYADGAYDLAGFAVGAVARDRIVDGSTVGPGDRLIGVSSRGLHSNGYSLARRALLDRAGLALDATPDGLDRPLADELLEPTAIYANTVAALTAALRPKALAHITGGGIAGNLPRVMPAGSVAQIDRSAWDRPVIFDLVRSAGDIEDEEMYRTFNMGIGMIAVVASDDADAALAAIRAAGDRAQLIGEVAGGEAGAGAVVRWSP